MLYYKVNGGILSFHGECGCTPFFSSPQMRTWGDAARWINDQTDPGSQKEVAARFGLNLENLNA